MKQRSLSAAVRVEFGTLGLLVAALGAVSWWAAHQADDATRDVLANAREAKDVNISLALKARDMKLHLVQVQQWLTDVSATRGAPGYDDGFGEAFDGYYAMGRQMARAYVDGGPATGNAMIGEFDTYAERLAGHIEPVVVDQVDASGQTLQDILDSIQQAGTIVEEIASASHEQSRGIRSVNGAVGQMNVITQQNAALVEEVAASAESVAARARGMQEQVARFQLDAQD
jgi:hypothetical protein